MFGSPRQAIAYMVAAQRGPAMARPRLDNTPRSTGRSGWDHALISTLLYGPQEQGGCGVVRDSPLDHELRAWATTKGHPRTREVEAVEKRLRRRLREHGLQVARPRIRTEKYAFEDTQGRTHDHTVDFGEYWPG